MATALALAGEVCAAAPLAVAAVEEVLAATASLDVQDAFRRLRSGDLPNYQLMMGSEDAVEGPRAFAEKREPRWRGR
jgi:crotonobetainyl-CoA hydratase